MTMVTQLVTNTILLYVYSDYGDSIGCKYYMTI